MHRLKPTELPLASWITRMPLAERTPIVLCVFRRYRARLTSKSVVVFATDYHELQKRRNGSRLFGPGRWRRSGLNECLQCRGARGRTLHRLFTKHVPSKELCHRIGPKKKGSWW